MEYRRTQEIFQSDAADLMRPILATAPETMDRAEESWGRRLGSYKLIGLLGVGGMGIVYLAERADAKFTQKVALKVVRTGIGQSARDRFERERQILARLIHPNIAALYDGGELADGQAFYTMEYVDGVPISLFCVESSITFEDRLRLLCDIASALAYAHQNLIVHRDIKPSNVLVTDSGIVKLVDFGIAKLLGDAGASEVTRTVAGPMTPDYAAPEQFRNEAITVATDIYQFGVLSFRMLTGAMPYKANPDDPYAWARAVTEEVPTTLSRALHSVSMRSVWAEHFDIDRLRRQMNGDIDVVVRKMLSKNPADRYASMDAVRIDLDAVVENRPINARRTNVAYVAARFCRRHRYLVTFGVAAALVIVVISTFAFRQMLIAHDQQGRADRENAVRLVTAVALTDLLRASSTDISMPRPSSALQALDQNATRIMRSIGSDPHRRALATSILAATYLELGHAQRALTMVEGALPAAQSDPHAFAPELLELTVLLARACIALGDVAVGAEKLGLAQNLIEQDNLPAESPLRVRAELIAIDIADHRGQRDEAKIRATQLLRDTENSELNESLEFADVLRVNAVKTADDTAAIMLFQRAWKIVAAHYGENSSAAMAAQRLIIMRDVNGPRSLDDMALVVQQEAQVRDAFGKQSPDYADLLDLRCEVSAASQLDDAEAPCGAALAIREKAGDTDPETLANAYDNDGRLLLLAGRPNEALSRFEAELETRLRAFAPKTQNVVHARLKIAEARCRTGNINVAIREFDKAIGDYIAQVGAEYPYEPVYAAYFSQCLLDAGRRDQAKRILTEHASLQIQRKNMSNEDRAEVMAVWHRLGGAGPSTD